MINFLGCSAQGIAVANGVTTLALLEHLVERKILTPADVRAILGSGLECLEPRINVRSVAEAVHLMRDDASAVQRTATVTRYRRLHRRANRPPRAAGARNIALFDNEV